MAVRATAVKLGDARPYDLYRRTDYPRVHANPLDKRSPKELYNRIRMGFPKHWKSFSNYGQDEKFHDMRGFSLYNIGTYRWPHFLKERKRFGWNVTPKDTGFPTYKTIMEKMHQTGEIEGELGVFFPQNIMQCWFGKRIQEKRSLTWAEVITKQRIYPHIYGWATETAPVSVYSELLNHQFRPAIDHDALTLMESFGGIDQFILQNDPMFLTAFELEKVRNFLLVRRMELDKNHVMEEQAAVLADHLLELIRDKRRREAETSAVATAE
ncbi:39S ribosomal protein L28 [Diplonema papillatum]|nr:39S ribosomal protein L28 [Diplonema papillatum]